MGMKDTASRLIAAHGQSAELLRPLPPVDDGFATVPNSGPPTPYPCKAFVANATVNEKFIAAGLMDVGDQRIFLSVDGLTITPETTDRIRIGATDLGIVRVSPLAPAGKVIFWELQVRNG